MVDLSLETGWQGRCRPQLGKLAEAELGSPGCGGETLLRADDVIAQSLQPVLLLAFFFSCRDAGAALHMSLHCSSYAILLCFYPRVCAAGRRACASKEELVLIKVRPFLTFPLYSGPVLPNSSRLLMGLFKAFARRETLPAAMSSMSRGHQHGILHKGSEPMDLLTFWACFGSTHSSVPSAPSSKA